MTAHCSTGLCACRSCRWLDVLDLHPTWPRRFVRCPPPWLWWLLIGLSPAFYFLTRPGH